MQTPVIFWHISKHICLSINLHKDKSHQLLWWWTTSIDNEALFYQVSTKNKLYHNYVMHKTVIITTSLCEATETVS